MRSARISAAVGVVAQYLAEQTELAMDKGVTEQEIMEAIWVAAGMRAGGAYAHWLIAIDAMNPAKANPDG